jgi:Mg/Co/Ni transporter MgtE
MQKYDLEAIVVDEMALGRIIDDIIDVIRDEADFTSQPLVFLRM